MAKVIAITNQKGGVGKGIESGLQHVNVIYFCSLTHKKVELGSKNIKWHSCQSK
jgi:septum formation inhibitor-activating ATPase MinD